MMELERARFAAQDMAKVNLNVLHQFKPGKPSTWASEETGAKTQWQISRDPVTGSQDELFVCGKRVVWYSGLHPSSRVVKVSYTMETAVLQALWCLFEDGDKEAVKATGDAQPVRGVCVREQEYLTLFLQTGAVHHVTLPFQVSEVWSLSSGLLIARSLSSEGGYEGLPTLFTLLHPSDDLCPVTCRRPAQASVDATVLGFFSDPQTRVLCVSVDSDGEPLIVSVNLSTSQHSVWSVKQATQKDVPAHVTTPTKSSSNVETPQPLSSSAPSYYDDDVIATPRAPALMDTPVEMVLSARRVHHDSGHTHLPVLSQVQRRGAVGSSTGKQEGGSGVKGHKTGRSPYITRLQTPHKKHSKSLSPHILARISPFSQAVNSRSWSTFYSDEFSFGRNFEPLFPQVCLWQVWKEEVGTDKPRPVSEAASLYRTCDFIGNKYLLLCLFPQQQLWLINYTIEKGKPLSFGAMTTVPAMQVVPIEEQPLFVLMDTSGGLQLYSGTHKVAAINTQSLFSQLTTFADDSEVAMETNVDVKSSLAVGGIRDPLGCGFTVVCDSGEMLRCSVTEMFRNSTVSLCLHALREVLPPQLAMELLVSYYTTAHSLSFSELTKHFESWLVSCLGMPKEDGQVGGTAELSPWERLQQMVHTENLVSEVPALEIFLKDGVGVSGAGSFDTTPSCSTSPCLKDHAKTVLLALHLAYEELKLNTLNGDHLPQLASLLSHISTCLHLHSYTDHYWRDFPHLQPAAVVTNTEERPPTPPPPHILHWLTQALCNNPVNPFPTLPSVCTRTTKILKLYSLYCTGEGVSVELDRVVKVLSGEELSPLDHQGFKQLQESTPFPWERVVLCMAVEGLGLSDLETLPVGVALPVWDSIIQCQENPPSTWPQTAYDIIGRRDIVKSLNVSASNSHLKMEDPKECGDGMEISQEILQLRFPADQRVGVVRRFLQSFNPVRIALTQKPEVSDHDYLELQESHLLMLCQRTMALPVGRGMFTLSTAQPLPTAHLAIPTLNLSGRVPPKNSTVGLDHIDKPADMSAWAEFHNGVAAGLKIAPGMSQLNRAWIVYNRPTSEDSSNEYAGFLMALGLQGHLTSVPHYALYNHLKEKHELTVIGLLLGVATTGIKLESLPLASLLSIYFPPLLPHGSADMEVPSPIQTAAMLGLGYIYRSSGNRHMTEMMLKEIGRTQGPELDFAVDRESYSLTAGLALGLITLGVGSSLLGLSSLHLVDQLCVLMNGGPKTQVTMPKPVSEGYLVLEGNQVNTHVTAPGAILALILMYLKTNDSTVAATLEAPSTLYELEGIRPDFLLLRALGYCLIMWDSVEPTVEWIKAYHLPKIVTDHVFQGVKGKISDAIDYQTLSQAYVNIMTGCCLGMGLRYAGTSDPRVKICLLECLRELLDRLESSGVEQVGKACLEKCVVTVLLALAVVMSGSGDLDVLRMVRRLRLSHSEVCYGSHMAVHMALGLLFIGGGRYSLNRSNESIASLLISLYPMFPNSSTDNRYHLQAFRHLYVLAAEPRVLITRDVTSGKTCSVGVEILSDGSVKRTLTPCIVPEWSTIDKISVCSNSYWPMTFDLKSSQQGKLRQSLPITGCIFVKQRTTQFSESSRHGWSYGLGMVKGVVDISPADLSGDPIVKTVCQQLAQPHMQKDSPWTKFLVACLLDCVQNERFQVFTSLLQLEQCTLKASKFSEILTTQFLWQVKLALALSLHSNGNRLGKVVLSRDFAEGLMMRLKNSLDDKGAECCGSAQRVNELLQQYLYGSSASMATSLSEKESRLLAAMLVLFDIPQAAQLKLSGHWDVQELYARLNTLGVPKTATVRLLFNTA